MRKVPALDLMQIYSKGDTDRWNRILQKCYDGNDLNKLFNLLYGIQGGMDDLAKKKLNTPSMNEWSLRLLRSVEKTIKKINKKLTPSILDTANADVFKKVSEEERKRKKDRDLETEKLIRKMSY